MEGETLDRWSEVCKLVSSLSFFRSGFQQITKKERERVVMSKRGGLVCSAGRGTGLNINYIAVHAGVVCTCIYKGNKGGRAAKGRIKNMLIDRGREGADSEGREGPKGKETEI